MKNKVEVIKKVLKNKCYVCDGTGKVKEEVCKVCNNGVYEENFYYHVVNGICVSGDTLK